MCDCAHLEITWNPLSYQKTSISFTHPYPAKDIHSKRLIMIHYINTKHIQCISHPRQLREHEQSLGFWLIILSHLLIGWIGEDVAVGAPLNWLSIDLLEPNGPLLVNFSATSDEFQLWDQRRGNSVARWWARCQPPSQIPLLEKKIGPEEVLTGVAGWFFTGLLSILASALLQDVKV